MGGWSQAQALRCGGRDEVRAALQAERGRTLSLIDAYAAALGPSLAVPRSPGLNPPLWEWGHVAWFQQWWVGRNPHRHRGARCDPQQARPPSRRPGADALYDSSAVPHASRWSLPLPGLGATHEALADTLGETLALLDALPPDAGDDALYFFRLAALHEAMHAEAACYMAHALGFEVPVPASVPGPSPVRASHGRPAPPGPATELAVPAQAWTLGWPGPGFAFDNELAPQAVALDAFRIDDRPVSWERFQGFVQAGGYADRRWWTEAGWAWRQQARPAQPQFPQGQAPATHLGLHEVQAWCAWAGRRLPTEAQWECAALTQPGFAWGRVWEWTASPFAPFPGFEPHPYRDYSQPWFGTRQVLRGASAATSASLAHPRYRNFFEPHRTDVHSGFRSCA